ncbi:trehalase-like isoform X2 [Myxocyprinus asiaticus]|uniref:trehalase-like isoform X2 n=1 Tax=Myxocyprinus asiaticus TaxID=70543 RepID=UPI0022230622|nr:trehalase-like isoform X2 [Myxocyprinus asiaticus]
MTCLFVATSQIYCTGEVLRQVQMAKLFDDNKYFVDMKLTAAPEVVGEAFANLTSGFPNRTVSSSELMKFLKKYFEEPGKEFEMWTPTDWHSNPKILSRISDPQYRSWAEELHGLWKSLGRKIRDDVRDHPELYSQIYTPHPIVVPGGRFRELYYWDSYWVINGLLLSEMTETARGMILNFMYLVEKYGFVPNGGRIYYARRSQPPFLPLMVESFYELTRDKDFLRQVLPALEKEYSFWMQNRSHAVELSGVTHILNHYNVQAGGPRPESYSDDVELAKDLSTDAQEKLWIELKTGAESGWDFSSRWYIDSKGLNNGTLHDTQTSSILPVDLNAIMCRNEHLLESFNRILGNEHQAVKYEQALSARIKAVESLLWDTEKGAWFDFSLVTKTRHLAFYPSNLAPIWAHCYSRPGMADQAVQYLRDSGGLDYPNGIPTSLSESGQQWDMPNAWPPLQHMIIKGLSGLDSAHAKELAFDLAQWWIQTNWRAYAIYEAMFEKYDVNGDGKPGGGGEYEVQLGFGWTNGVALQLLNQYGDRLSSGGCILNASVLIGLVYSILKTLL